MARSLGRGSRAAPIRATARNPIGARRWLAALVVLALAACSKLTPENYAKLKVGMPYREVVAILGAPDRCEEAMGFKSCRWGDERRNVTVRFAGETVVIYSAQDVN